MALNLSTLTNPATSGDVLAEALTTADFLEPVPVLRNLARGSQKGGDAKQSVSLNQPRALPLIKNPSGNLGGYLYIPNVTGNYATGPSVTIGANQTWQAEVDMLITQNADYTLPFGGGAWTGGFGLFIDQNGRIYVWSKGVNTPGVLGAIPFGTPFNLKYGYDGTSIYFDVDGVRKQTLSVSSASQSASITHPVQLNQQTLSPKGNYAIQKAKLTVNNAVVFDCDFNGSTSIRHGDTKFQASVGGPVTINQSGNDPATIIKKPVLRFDGANSSLQGLFANNIDSGYMFAAFSVLGDGGESWGRVFTVNQTGQSDATVSGNIFSAQETTTGDLAYAAISGSVDTHQDLFDDANGDILHEVKVTNSTQSSLVNGADFQSKSASLSMQAQEFNIGQNEGRATNENACLDLEYLALFSADSVPDEATASKIRNYINKRNNVFSLVDNSFYFFDPQKADFTGNFTDANTLDGYITGSDLGDTDVRSNLTLEQSTLNDQPSTDGYTITFNDAAEHLEFENSASQNLSGWQVVGTSLGTFAYRVQGAVTELNLLGNAGLVRTAGDSYGVLLLPDSATGADIEEARKLLIDRGAADSPANVDDFWRTRSDIVEFNFIDTSNVTSFVGAWRECSSLLSFPSIDASSGVYFNNVFRGTSALTSFPAGAKLGTAATNVNFNSAWQSSGLTSFPALDLSNGNIFASAFKLSQLTSFPEDILLGTNSTAVRFDACWMNCSGLTSFPNIDLSEGRTFNGAWYNNNSLVNFPALFTNWNPSTVTSSVFNAAWTGCSSLSSTSVENILTSIDSSGVFGTYTGLVTGTALPDAAIDIDYNVATGALSAATNAAIDSLSGKGWEVFINGVLVIPNILDLQPAAAYSLRSFDADADPVVVNVRRSSDSALRDFKASEVSDGTLVAFCGPRSLDNNLTNWTKVSASATSTSITTTATGGAYLSVGVGTSVRVQATGTRTGADVALWSYYGSSNALITTLSSSFNIDETFTASSPMLFFRAVGVAEVNFTSLVVTSISEDGHVTTWYDQSIGGTNHATQTVASSQPKLVDGGTLVTDGGQAAVDFDGASDSFDMNHSDLYGQSTFDSYYVTSTSDAQYIYPRDIAGRYGFAADTGSTNSTIHNTYGTPTLYSNGTLQSISNRGDVHTANNGYKLVNHQGADTSAWVSFSFGRYANVDSVWDYNGKLQEMIFFNTDQSANRTGIENNINDHFDIYS